MVINKIQTIHMKRNRNITNLKQGVIMESEVLEGVQQFRYLDTLKN
jgi:hypothetical protein